MKLILFIFLFVLTLGSCKKDNFRTADVASLTLVNCVFAGDDVVLGNQVSTVSNNWYTQFALYTGANNLYVWPVSDSLHPYYSQANFVAESRAIYSLFLCGTASTPDGVLVRDDIPYRTDSTAGIRFINLSANTGSKPLTITLSTSPTVNEVSSLAYKQNTGFKTYEGKYNSTYTFQVRNDTCASPKAPLATFSLSSTQVPRFANITLVIRQNGANGVAVFQVKNDR